MRRTRSTMTKAAAVACGLTLALAGGTATANANPADNLSMLTNPSELNVSKDEEGNWSANFVNKTGESLICIVHVYPEETIKKMMAWAIANPDEAAEGNGMAFGEEVDALRTENNNDGKGAMGIAFGLSGDTEEPQPIDMNFPSNLNEKWASAAFCTTGNPLLGQEGETFVELYPHAPKFIDSIENQVPLGSLGSLGGDDAEGGLGSVSEEQLGSVVGGLFGSSNMGS